jgi:chemotaxis protein methyltransferase CheR
MNRSLTDSELLAVCEVIAARIGLHFPFERKTILSRNLASASREFGYNNMNDFIQWLLSSPLNQEQVNILAAHLTISETYFWREQQVFTALTDYVLPEIINSKKNKEKSITIWSAGCSTGEEAYSIAIALHRTIPKIKDWKITILATDINSKSLSKARTGVYSSGSFRNSPPWLKSSWFKSTGNKEYKIIPEIKKMVTISNFNLTENDFLSSVCINNKLDLIFCRNVLMYFTSEWATKVSQNLFHSLSEDGWLVVSSCELSSNLFSRLKPVNFPGAILYRKTQSESNNSYNADALNFTASEKKSFQPPQPLQSVNLAAHYPSSKLLNPPQPLSSVAFAKEESHSIAKHREESFTDRINAIRLLAGKGQLKEALSACDKAILSYKLAPGLYFLRASILQELDKCNEAIRSLKQAIYIDPNYIMGYFTLGNLFLRQGNIKNAKLNFSNALNLLNSCANDDDLPESEGLSVKYIRDIIYTNMQIKLTK